MEDCSIFCFQWKVSLDSPGGKTLCFKCKCLFERRVLFLLKLSQFLFSAFFCHFVSIIVGCQVANWHLLVSCAEDVQDEFRNRGEDSSACQLVGSNVWGLIWQMGAAFVTITSSLRWTISTNEYRILWKRWVQCTILDAVNLLVFPSLVIPLFS